MPHLRGQERTAPKKDQTLVDFGERFGGQLQT
jgi:hypothetical protein